MSLRAQRLFLLMLWLLAPPVMAQPQTLTTADRSAIQAVIERQIEAFRQDDAAGAFAVASPMIQAKFGSPENFLQMVQTAYQAVYRPQYVAFKDLHVADSMTIQQVFLIGPDGVPVMALYMMEKQPDGAWKIDGCYLRTIKDERL